MTASAGSWTPGEVSTTYQWRAHGADIVGATARTLHVSKALIGKRVRVRVTASETGYPTTTASSARTARVQPGALTNTVAPTITGEASVGSTLTADPGAWNPAPDTLSYQWLAGDVAIEGATNQSLAVDPSMLGKPLAVSVTARKSGYSRVSVTSSPTADVVPGTLTLTDPPTLTGSAKPGETLTLAPAATTPAAQATVTWLRSGHRVAGATGSTYALTASDLGSRISARVRLTREGYTTLRVRTPLSARVKSTPALHVSMHPGTGRLRVDATVKAFGTNPVAGIVRVRSRGEWIGETQLSDGAGRLHLTGLRKGTWTFRVIFPATRTVTRGAVARSVTIR
jgi:hypothetical protein